MTDLTFHGPLHFINDVDQKTGEIKNHSELPNLKRSGIYIWGFKYPDENKFIPYYVGKSLSNIFDRIGEHKQGISIKNSTYTRLSENFMKSFYTHDKLDFLIKSTKSQTKVPDWFKYLPSDGVEYLNARWFIYLKTGIDPGKNTNYPISLLNLNNDFLKKNIEDIYVCYAIVETNIKNKDLCNDFYEYLESITKISLRGRTFGKKEKGVQSNHFILDDSNYSVNIKNKSDQNEPLYYLFKDNFDKMIFPGY